MKPYEILDILIKCLALIGATITVIIGLKNLKIGLSKLQHTFIRARHSYLDDFYEQFLGMDVIRKRGEIAKCWVKYLKREPDKCLPINVSEIGYMASNDEIKRLLKLKNDALKEKIKHQETKLLDYLRRKAGINFINILEDSAIEGIDMDIINLTEELLNKYEHLGKLHEGGAITDEDINLFFYTMLADTFVLTLPYILYRRRKKPQYAYKMQSLIKVVPYLSGDLGKV